MNPSGQVTTPVAAPLNLTAAEIVSYLGLGLTALGLGALGGKIMGEAVALMRHPAVGASGAARSNPFVNAHHVSGYLRDGHRVHSYHMPGHHAALSRHHR